MNEELFPDAEAELLSQLEARVVKALEAVAMLKKEKAALQQEVERLNAELDAVRSKNKTAASRISRLLEQMDLPGGD
jgi:predicted  nucleic acid-binding Zn-ribbon protein